MQAAPKELSVERPGDKDQKIFQRQGKSIKMRNEGQFAIGGDGDRKKQSIQMPNNSGGDEAWEWAIRTSTETLFLEPRSASEEAHPQYQHYKKQIGKSSIPQQRRYRREYSHIHRLLRIEPTTANNFISSLI